MSKLNELIDKLCPNGIDYVDLEEICEVYDGTHQTPEYTSEGVKFVSVQNISGLYDTDKYVSQEDYEKFRIKPRIGDVFMTRIGSIGVCAVVDRTEPLAYYVSLALLRPDSSRITSNFLKHVIESNYGKKELLKRTLVNAVPIKINKNEIGKIVIPLPPVEVQEEIVRILDEYSEKNAQLIEALQTELDARKVQYEYYRETVLGTLSEYNVELEKYCSFQNGFAFKSTKFKDVGLPIIRISNIQDSEISHEKMVYFDMSDYKENLEKYIVRNGDVVIAMSGATTGKIATNNSNQVYYINQRVGKFVPDSTKLLSEYLFFVLEANAKMILQMSEGGAQPNLSSEDIKKMVIPIPSIELQEKIINQMKCLKVNSMKLIECIESEIALRQTQYEYYRDKLLTFKEAN